MDSTPIYQVNFASFNIFMTDIPKELSDNLNKKANSIKENWDAPNFGKNLAGHIQNQYSLDNMTDLKKFVLELSYVYYNQLAEEGNMQQCTSNNPTLVSGEPWINFQGPTEYNPLHNHSGLFSWVIWLKIPYDREKEKAYFPHRENVLNGAFQFVYTSHNGGISTHIFHLDKEYESRLAIFPSTLQHAVYPFYTTDEYRVSIAGNVYIENSPHRG